MKINRSDTYRNESKFLQPNTVYIGRKNPLLVLTEHSEFNKSGFITLSEETRQTIDRILGNQDLSIKIRTIYRMSAPVLTEKFKKNIMGIIHDRELDIQKSDISLRRIKTGTLEIPWSTMDAIPTTKHHIIASSRNGINDDRNYVFLPEDVHQDFHKVFYAFTPIEQIAYLILLFYTPENIEFSQEISQLILRQNQNHFYCRELLKNREIKDSCFMYNGGCA